MLDKLFKWQKNRDQWRKKPLTIQVKGEDAVLYEGEIKEYPFSEEIILKQSMEWFQDSEPCYIHRSAVIHRMVLAIDDFLRDKEGQSIPWADAPDEIQLYMDLGKGHRIAYFIRKT